jgi:hypothetical protein
MVPVGLLGFARNIPGAAFHGAAICVEIESVLAHRHFRQLAAYGLGGRR